MDGELNGITVWATPPPAIPPSPEQTYNIHTRKCFACVYPISPRLACLYRRHNVLIGEAVYPADRTINLQGKMPHEDSGGHTFHGRRR